MNMINANENIIYEVLLGPGRVVPSTDHKEAKVSHLHTDNKETLAMIYFPGAKGHPDSSINKLAFSLQIQFAGQPGKYRMRLQQNGKEISQKVIAVPAENKQVRFDMENVKREDVLFVSITQ